MATDSHKCRPVTAETLLSVPLFESLSFNELTKLKQYVITRRYSTNTVLLQQGHSSRRVYVLLRGTVRVIRRPCGTAQRALSSAACAGALISLYGQHQVIGDLDAIDGLGHSTDVITLEECEVLEWSSDQFITCVLDIPGLSRNLLRSMAYRLRYMMEHAEALTTLDVRGKVARQILLFAQEYGVPLTEGDLLIPLRISQSDLASLVGASRESVNRELSLLQRQGSLFVEPNSRVRLIEPQALSLLCGFVPQSHSKQSYL